jgi:hypothetical protein
MNTASVSSSFPSRAPRLVSANTHRRRTHLTPIPVTRPLAVLRNGVAAVMGYGPDGERNLKLWNNNTSFFISNDADLLVNTAYSVG